jgi:type II secretory ATPase GspE/PulE/Tfp pilus assembly ATPase PilB-like protein
VIVPLESRASFVRITISDPGQPTLLEGIALHLDCLVAPVWAATATIRTLLARLETPATQPITGTDVKTRRDGEALRRAETDGPVIRFAQENVTNAVLQGASDVHVECTKDGFAVPFRLDGVLVPQRTDLSLDPSAVIAGMKVWRA